jgi:hypothetical protein
MADDARKRIVRFLFYLKRNRRHWRLLNHFVWKKVEMTAFIAFPSEYEFLACSAGSRPIVRSLHANCSKNEFFLVI